MYRQIIVHEADRNLQCILWKDHPAEPVKDYRLRTVTYGTSSASFLAQNCLRTLAREASKISPLAAEAISYDFYMDDLITGSDDLESTCRLQNDAHSILQSAGFNLRKYLSNSAELPEQIGPELLKSVNDYDVKERTGFPVLGLLWCSSSDIFRVKSNLNDLPPIPTKRVQLSEISRIFDPLGFLSPAIIRK